jgi:hypothetical protein
VRRDEARPRYQDECLVLLGWMAAAWQEERVHLTSAVQLRLPLGKLSRPRALSFVHDVDWVTTHASLKQASALRYSHPNFINTSQQTRRCGRSMNAYIVMKGIYPTSTQVLENATDATECPNTMLCRLTKNAENIYLLYLIQVLWSFDWTRSRWAVTSRWSTQARRELQTAPDDASRTS